MEYEDELERMRRRRQHQRTRAHDELDVIDFDQLDQPRPRKAQTERRNSQKRKPPQRRNYEDYEYETVYEDSRESNGHRPNRYGDSQETNRRRPNRKEQKNSSLQKNKKKHRFGFLKIFFMLITLTGVYFGYRYVLGGTGVWTVAVFGVDSRNGSLEKGALSDVEMLCVIDQKTGEIKLVSVFRDTYLEISPDGTYHKINEAYFKGGHEQAVEALERNLDLTIDDYATFNWKAVADAITILGGIDLEISDSEFRYINAFITETVESTGLGSHHLEHAGMNHLDGVQAVAYARLRLMDTDYNRTARQRLVIQLAMNKAKEADFKTLSIVAKTVLPQLSTSISLDDVISMAKSIKKYHIGETGGFPFSRGEADIGKKDCVIPLTLESNVTQLHYFLYGTEGYQPSDIVKQISAQIAADSGMGEVAENAPEARVTGQKALEGGNSGSSQGSDISSTPTKGQTIPASQPESTQTETEPITEETSEESSEETSVEEDGSTESAETITEQSVTETTEGPESPNGPGQMQTTDSDNPVGPGVIESNAGSNSGPGVSSESSGTSGSANSGEKPRSEVPEVGPGVP